MKAYEVKTQGILAGSCMRVGFVDVIHCPNEYTCVPDIPTCSVDGCDDSCDDVLNPLR